MKPDEQKLKELFKRAAAVNAEIPSFEAMWAKAARVKPRRIFLLRMAAGISLVAVASLFLLRSDPDNIISGEIETWQDPSDAFIPSEMTTGTSALSGWNSPTAFLLDETIQKIK